jgi:hypothetical protein
MTMTDPTTAPHNQPDIETQLTMLRNEQIALGLEVHALRNELAALRAELATEVRTQRIAVVDAEGTERIYSTISSEVDGYAQLAVVWGDFDTPQHSQAVMSAMSECAGAEAHIYISVADDIVFHAIGSFNDPDETDRYSGGHANGDLSIRRQSYGKAKDGKAIAAHQVAHLDLCPDGIAAGVGGHDIATAQFNYAPR